MIGVEFKKKILHVQVSINKLVKPFRTLEEQKCNPV